MYSVILCGGSGTRLWPLSRKNFPKQFLRFYNDKSLLQETFLRMRKLMPIEKIFFVTNNKSFYNVLNQIKEIDKNYSKSQILIEPMSLNTAPAITFAIKHLIENVKILPSEQIIFLPSDHYIKQQDKFLDTISNVINYAEDHIAVIGIKPNSPKTSYGYIKKGIRHENYYIVDKFKEKPNKEIAKEYLESGSYLWNSGIYIFTSKTFINELKIHAPLIHDIYMFDFSNFLQQFNKMPKISIDFAISEKSNNIIIFEGNFEWNDIGSFDNLAEIEKINNNSAKHIDFDSKNIFTHSTKKKLIATLGVEDIGIIENNDSILVYKRGRSEDVKKIVNFLEINDYNEINDNIINYRPWGYYEILIDNTTYKVKKIIVYPGEKISLQSHMHRTEHWIIVKGLAKIVNNENIIYLKQNESTFIAPMTKHRIENIGKINVEFIEVQTGDYLEEDDIVRFEDIYSR